MTSKSERSFSDPMIREICDQPDVFAASSAAMAAQRNQLAAAHGLIAGSSRVILTGMGSSFDALLAFTSRLTRRGHDALPLNSAELLHFGQRLLTPGTVVLAVSQSGRSAELVELLRHVRALGGVELISVTNGLDNPLASGATVAIDMTAGNELGPATKSFAASMVALASLDELMDAVAPVGDLATAAVIAAAQADQFVHEPERLGRELAAWYGDDDHPLVILGRGVGLATAEVAGLVLKEAAQVPAISMDAAEFRHGPLELAGPRVRAVIVSLEPSLRRLDERLARDLRAAGGGVLSIGHSPIGADRHLAMTASSPLLDVAIAAIPLQLMAWSIADGMHDVAGVFRIGSKTTESE